MAVLARPQGGTIHNPELNIPRPKRNAIVDLLYDSNLVGKNGRGGEKEIEKERRKKKARAKAAEPELRR